MTEEIVNDEEQHINEEEHIDYQITDTFHLYKVYFLFFYLFFLLSEINFFVIYIF
jgi:hypothetical protein